MTDHLLALGAGLATVASPCVLPMLPLILGVAAIPAPQNQSARGQAALGPRLRPVWIVLGFVLAFAGTALAFRSSLRVLGLSPDGLRLLAVSVLAASGVLLARPTLLDRLGARLGLVNRIAHRVGRIGGESSVGALMLGASLGLLWTPCAGPLLASALALVGSGQDPAHGTGLLAAYAAGAGLPMLAVAYGGQALRRGLQRLARWAAPARRVMGLSMVAAAVALHAGWDLRNIAGTGPGPEDASLLAAPLSQAQEMPATAPEFDGIAGWFNSPPLRMASLRGRVVLVDFWTQGCINCIRTLPHLQRWHERYGQQGLVIVGVHTPEFAHERAASRVASAIDRWQIPYPVAQDNHYRTWAAWRNQYWPAVYLVDRHGRVVFHHAGEGDYDVIEAAIQRALQ